MKSIFYCTILILMTLMFSCKSKNEEGNGGETVTAEFSESKAVNQTAKFNPPVVVEDDMVSDNEASKSEFIGDKTQIDKKKIIKDGSISIKTNDIAASKKGIDGLLKKNEAYYETENLENNDQTISYTLKIRIPSDKFEIFLSSIENGKDEITSKSIQARDVTEEYVDIKTRLANKSEFLKRYKELLSKASTVKDILAIEENIRNLQEEIESKEGRLNYLNDQIAFSTIDINLYKEKEFIYKPQAKDRFWERVKRSVSNGWTSIVDFVIWTITLWPLLILIIVLLFIFKRVIKKHKSK